MDEEARELRSRLVRAVAWAELAGDAVRLDEIAWRHNLTVEQLGGWLEEDGFWPAVEEQAAQMRLSGEEHRLKARGAVAEMMPDVVGMFYDEATQPAVRAQIYKELARQAGLGEDGADGRERLPVVSVTIDMRGDGGGEAQVVASTGARYPVVAS